MTVMTRNPGSPGPLARSALTRLALSLDAYLQAQNTGARAYLGLKNRDLWDTSRVVLIDGEFDGSNSPKPRAAGIFQAPWHKASVNPRELVGWARPVTLSIRAVDATAPDDELAQTEATEALIESTLQGLQNAMWQDPISGLWLGIGQANIDWGESKAVWVDPGTATQQTWGKEFLVGFIYKCVFYDLQEGVAFPVPAIRKNLVTTLESGVGASVLSAGPGAGTAVISGLGFADPSWVGKLELQLTRASSAGNNGTFPIAFLLSPTSLVISNAAAVAPDANNGAIAWQLVPAG
jgi:hypothetical protein